MTIQTKNLTLYKGDTRIFRIGFDGGGLPFEPKSAQWAMTVRGQTGEELRPQISVSGQEIIITRRFWGHRLYRPARRNLHCTLHYQRQRHYRREYRTHPRQHHGAGASRRISCRRHTNRRRIS